MNTLTLVDPLVAAPTFERGAAWIRTTSIRWRLRPVVVSTAEGLWRHARHRRTGVLLVLGEQIEFAQSVTDEMHRLARLDWTVLFDALGQVEPWIRLNFPTKGSRLWTPN